MRLVLIVLAFIYFFIRVLWVDGKQERYFIVDYDEAVDFVSSFSYDPVGYVNKEILPYFNAVSITLKNLNTLKNEGVVDLADYNSLKIQPKPWALTIDYKNFDSNTSFIFCPYFEKLDKIEKIIKALKLDYQRNGNVLIVKADSRYLFNLSVFFVDEAISNKKIFWRISSYVYDLEYLKVFVKKGDVVVFTGPFVAGYPNNLNQVRTFLQSNNIIFAFPEFYDSKNIQFGSSSLSKDGAIKIFSTAILKNKSKEGIINSIDLAVNERNCRAVLFRFFDRYSLQENIEIIKNVKNSVFGNENYFKSNSSPLENGLFILILSYICLIFLALWVFFSYSYYYDTLVSNGYRLSSEIFLIGGIINSLGIIISKVLEIYVLFNFFVIVGVSFILVTLFFRIFEIRKDVFMRYFELTFYAVCIGLVVNSVFFNQIYWLGAQKVGFIKLLLILPILLSIFMIVPYNQLVLFFYRRVKVLDLGLIILFLGLGIFYLLRSGNTDFTLPFEEKVRTLFDKIFIARPRFKEFIIGNPSILLSSYYRFFIPFSFISLGGIVDSFLHIHTPVFYSFLRTFWAVLLGLVVFLLINKAMKVILKEKDNIKKGV